MPFSDFHSICLALHDLHQLTTFAKSATDCELSAAAKVLLTLRFEKSVKYACIIPLSVPKKRIKRAKFKTPYAKVTSKNDLRQRQKKAYRNKLSHHRIQRRPTLSQRHHSAPNNIFSDPLSLAVEFCILPARRPNVRYRVWFHRLPIIDRLREIGLEIFDDESCGLHKKSSTVFSEPTIEKRLKIRLHIIKYLFRLNIKVVCYLAGCCILRIVDNQILFFRSQSVQKCILLIANFRVIN